MDKRIVDFIAQNKVFTMATSHNDKPYCASCFYAFDEKNQLLIFSSENDTNHIKQAILNSDVSGTINTVVTTIEDIQGIQLLGQFINPNKTQAEAFYEQYYTRFPFAKNKPAPIWGIKLTWVKMTDNSLGFGTKLIWNN